MYEPVFASHAPSVGCIDITNASILIDKEDFEGIHIAAEALAEDFARVTGNGASPILYDRSQDFDTEVAIVLGSITRSPTIQKLIQDGKLDVTAIDGQWECYITTVLHDAIQGVKKALVIAGSDKRGAIYGLYTLSDQIGVSPWYWWADVPPKQSSEIYALNVVTKHGPPSVKYRGIFINDEAPSLTGWVHEKYGPKFNVDFYKRVFELLLRLKANFLWPAMWFGFPHPGSSFFMDDPLNQETADKYGIVMSTSHHEPMQRAMNEWFDHPYYEPEKSWSWSKNKPKITKYFQEGADRARKYESYITMGMRGHGDRAMDAEDPSAVLKDVLSTQRSIIKNTYGEEDAVHQLMALYKEVQEYYENGLHIPEDITLLFADDNFGTVRRLPSGDESTRHGGAGIYYHLEYVGVPRSYKWLNSNSCAKVWQQLEQTYNRGANDIWIFNVGDLKPMEVPLTFVLTLAWDARSLQMNQLQEFFYTFVEHTFHLGSAVSQQCSELLLKYDRLVALRKHEHIEPETFSLIHYGEAEDILRRWEELLSQAEELEKSIPAPMMPAYFQLILHPIKASCIYVALRVAQAKNQLFAVQRRNSANTWAYEALRLFEEDFNLSEEYHSLLNGKWNHIMRQPHYGYTQTWHAPSRDMISGLSFVQNRQDSNPVVGWIGVAVDGHPGIRPGLTNEESDRTHPSRRDLVAGVTLPPMEPYGPKSRYFEIYCRGTKSVSWTLTSTHRWLTLSPSSGTIQPKGGDERVKITVDWERVPSQLDDILLVDLRSSLGDYEQIHIPVSNRTVSADATGFVEADGHVSIYATSFINSPLSAYRILPFIGRTPTGGVALTAGTPVSHSEYLQYPFITFTPTAAATLILEFTLTLDTDTNLPITYDIQLDDGALASHRLVPQVEKPGKLPDGWQESVMDNIWTRRHSVDLSLPGLHKLRVRLQTENCVLEKIVVDLGGVRDSYLGPPESFFHQGKYR
ncbi:hypothetical protein BDV35DRAFT_397917 [Aspergillus flavus]|nr:hypothetical protein BDV35DRAFT_397917 [Aspergillus flavus]QMW48785.1 hypothetical protein G4B11_012303 [Aspergillus flavus]RAQ62250.1 hypothetical protein COH20_002950 [Aspergillus flavus]RAQ79049.1 hypothetical protein COH21_005345 [Aspergillus flavus]RMZ44038.1 hypothetical protein CA14_004455 [Aspergillus flavus]